MSYKKSLHWVQINVLKYTKTKLQLNEILYLHPKAQNELFTIQAFI